MSPDPLIEMAEVSVQQGRHVLSRNCDAVLLQQLTRDARIRSSSENDAIQVLFDIEAGAHSVFQSRLTRTARRNQRSVDIKKKQPTINPHRLRRDRTRPPRAR